jgi:nucleotidyltransferase/DNA polymerase involved in DNA repair
MQRAPARTRAHAWQARALLTPVGGRVVHAYCEEGARVSYRPYREASGALMRLLRRFVNARVVEKASIDEAYVLCTPPIHHVRGWL